MKILIGEITNPPDLTQTFEVTQEDVESFLKTLQEVPLLTPDNIDAFLYDPGTTLLINHYQVNVALAFSRDAAGKLSLVLSVESSTDTERTPCPTHLY